MITKIAVFVELLNQSDFPFMENLEISVFFMILCNF